MLNMNFKKLNETEKKIVETLLSFDKKKPFPKITRAAQICGCSVSQVSKSIKKAGFEGYKQFISYLYFGEQPKSPVADEIERLKKVLADFELKLVFEFAELISRHNNIILFGYGPSAICAQYFEYKLHLCSNALVVTAPDEQSAMSMMNRATLLVIFTTTGRYRSFEKLTLEGKFRGAEVVIVSEEFNPVLIANCDHYFVLTRHQQPDTLKPYEKTRTVFFIFMEQVVQTLLSHRKNGEDTVR